MTVGGVVVMLAPDLGGAIDRSRGEGHVSCSFSRPVDRRVVDPVSRCGVCPFDGRHDHNAERRVHRGLGDDGRWERRGSARHLFEHDVCRAFRRHAARMGATRADCRRTQLRHVGRQRGGPRHSLPRPGQRVPASGDDLGDAKRAARRLSQLPVLSSRLRSHVRRRRRDNHRRLADDGGDRHHRSKPRRLPRLPSRGAGRPGLLRPATRLHVASRRGRGR